MNHSEGEQLRFPTLQELPEERTEYSLLVGHERTGGSWKTDDQLRSEYVQLTDGIIHDMTDGVYVKDPVTNETVKRKPDVVVWLDKSARPVSWLTKELWPILAPDAQGNVPQMPDFRYVNIDREQWVNTIDPSGVGFSDVQGIDPSIIRSLRSIFVEPKYKTEGLNEAIDTAPSHLDGKTILIVDEVRSSGRTLDYAMNFFARAFPSSSIATTYWMGGQTMKDGAVGNADLPVWYKEYDVRGRGVGNRNDKLSNLSSSRTQRLGRYFLSTPLPKEPGLKIGVNSRTDQNSQILWAEIHQLAKDIEDHKVLVVPSISREMDDFDERAQRLNGLSMEEFIAKKRELDSQKRPDKKS